MILVTDDEESVFLDGLYDDDVVVLKFEPVCNLILSAFMTAVDFVNYLLTTFYSDLLMLMLLLVDFLADDNSGRTIGFLSFCD